MTDSVAPDAGIGLVAVDKAVSRISAVAETWSGSAEPLEAARPLTAVCEAAEGVEVAGGLEVFLLIQKLTSERPLEKACPRSTVTDPDNAL